MTDPSPTSSQLEKKGNGDSQQSDDTVTEEEYPTALKLFTIVVALMLSMFLASLDIVRIPIVSLAIVSGLISYKTILSTTIPKITTDFNCLGDIGWY
jgi:MFS transporter, DHA2 family, glioxin efflux transporter